MHHVDFQILCQNKNKIYETVIFRYKRDFYRFLDIQDCRNFYIVHIFAFLGGNVKLPSNLDYQFSNLFCNLYEFADLGLFFGAILCNIIMDAFPFILCKKAARVSHMIERA